MVFTTSGEMEQTERYAMYSMPFWLLIFHSKFVLL